MSSMSSALCLTLSFGPVQLPFMVGNFDQVIEQLLHHHSKSRVVLPCTLYDLAKIKTDTDTAVAYKKVDYCTTDGMPLVWLFRWRTKKKIQRVYGPDIMAAVLAQTEHQHHCILCPDRAVLERLRKKLQSVIQKKKLHLELIGESKSTAERARIATRLSDFRPDHVWIGIGSPNQVALGTFLRDTVKISSMYWCVGAAVPFLAGTVQQAPRWMQQNGLEWLFRLIAEPKRLWKRYLVTMPLFLFQLLFVKIRGTKQPLRSTL